MINEADEVKHEAEYLVSFSALTDVFSEAGSNISFRLLLSSVSNSCFVLRTGSFLCVCESSDLSFRRTFQSSSSHRSETLEPFIHLSERRTSASRRLIGAAGEGSERRLPRKNRHPLVSHGNTRFKCKPQAPLLGEDGAMRPPPSPVSPPLSEAIFNLHTLCVLQEQRLLLSSSPHSRETERNYDSDFQ